MLFDWSVTGWVVPSNPAHSVRGPRHSVGKGSTTVMSSDDTSALLKSIDTAHMVGLRDRARGHRQDWQAFRPADVAHRCLVMVQRRTADAGIKTAIGNHSFRAIGMTDYMENGGDITVAQRMAGHANIKTTPIYDRRDNPAPPIQFRLHPARPIGRPFQSDPVHHIAQFQIEFPMHEDCRRGNDRKAAGRYSEVPPGQRRVIIS